MHKKNSNNKKIIQDQNYTREKPRKNGMRYDSGEKNVKHSYRIKHNNKSFG